MSEQSIGTTDQLKDPDYEVPMVPRIALGLQHVLAMFVSNVTPSIIIAGAAGFAFGGEDMVFFNSNGHAVFRHSYFVPDNWLWGCGRTPACDAGYQLCLCAYHDKHC